MRHQQQLHLVAAVRPSRATDGGDTEGAELEDIDEPAIVGDGLDADDDIAQPDAMGIEQREQPPLQELRRSTI